MISWLYRKIHIAVVFSEEGCDVGVSTYKNKKRLAKETRRFEGEHLYEELAEYVQKFSLESPYCYVSVLNSDNNQGAVEGCSLHEISESGDTSGIRTLCRKQKWMLYASIKELNGLKSRFSKIGLDFIFSPFSVIEHFFADKIGGDMALFALVQKELLTLAFFEKGKLEFAHHYPMHQEGLLLETPDTSTDFAIDEEEEHDDLINGINLDDIESLDDLEIIDELDDLNDLEDLDTLDEIEEFSEEFTVPEQHNATSKGMEAKEMLDRSNDSFHRFEIIQKALSQFYAGEHCHNRFVETVYIADATGGSAELKRYLEEELFVGVLVRRIDLVDEVTALSVIEEEG
ncbi:MAG: hypothetical protein AB7S65_11740 [Sulfuricurvum sp.]